MKLGNRFAAALLALWAPLVGADVWDTATDSDNNSGTDNTPIHGAVQVHDVGALLGPLPDQDWYVIQALPRRSYEVVLDGLTGDTGALTLEWLASDATTVLASGAGLGGTGCFSCTETARVENDTSGIEFWYVRVRNPACAVGCDNQDQYTFRFFETTVSVPRFNNSGSQATVLVMHNAGELIVAVSGHINLWSTAGALLGQQAFTLPYNATLVQNTATMPGGAGAAGVITISHDGRYGALSGKTVVLDVGTGFSFDTPFVSRPH